VSPQSRDLYAAWLNFTNVISSLTRPGNEQYLVEDADIAAYYANPEIDRTQWTGRSRSSTSTCTLGRQAQGRRRLGSRPPAALLLGDRDQRQQQSRSRRAHPGHDRGHTRIPAGGQLVAKIENHRSYGRRLLLDLEEVLSLDPPAELCPGACRDSRSAL
jgi:hypothetical protein